MEFGPAGDHVSLLQNDTLGWDDLVAPAPVHEALRSLAGEVALVRHAVPALLAGPAGVGKTLAARVVTAALRLDLVEVRLGEGEGQLVPAVVEGARAQHLSLLFADAERLRRPALDAALAAAPTLRGMLLFETRRPEEVEPRLRAEARRIELAAPSSAERRAIWQRALAAADPTAEVDLDELAEIPDLTGRDVVTAVHRAAMNARALGQPLGYPLLAAQLVGR